MHGRRRLRGVGRATAVTSRERLILHISDQWRTHSRSPPTWYVWNDVRSHKSSGGSSDRCWSGFGPTIVTIVPIFSLLPYLWCIILTYNLRETTRECVHLVRHGHFRSRDKDGGHTIRSAIAANPMVHANFTAVFIRTRDVCNGWWKMNFYIKVFESHRITYIHDRINYHAAQQILPKQSN